MLHLTGMHTFSSLSRGVLFFGSPSLCDLRRWGGDTADHTFHMHRGVEKEWEDEEKWEKRAQEAGRKDLRREFCASGRYQLKISVVPRLCLSPAGELSDWAISAAIAEVGFSLFPNIWDGARLKDPGSEFDYGRKA